MGHVIPLDGDRHATARRLLPWYATGRLDAADRSAVDAHLAGCAACLADLELERQLAAEVANLSFDVDVDTDWSALRRGLDTHESQSTPRWTPAGLGEAVWRLIGGPHNLAGWSARAIVVLIAGMAGALIGRPAMYHALGAPPVTSAGNVIVVFRPDTTEAKLRDILNASGARLVDGPTTADAYVLRVPTAQFAGALAKLRERHEVVVAEPIDPAS